MTGESRRAAGANSKERQAGQCKDEECQSERVQEHEMSSWERKTRSIAASVAETSALSNTEHQGEAMVEDNATRAEGTEAMGSRDNLILECQLGPIAPPSSAFSLR